MSASSSALPSLSSSETRLLRLTADQLTSAGGSANVELGLSDLLSLHLPPTRMVYFYSASARQAQLRQQVSEAQSPRACMDADLLQATLNQLLTSYPILTGALSAAKDGTPVIKMSNSGVPFTVNRVGNLTLDNLQLGPNQFLSRNLPDSVPFVAALPPPHASMSQLSKLPLLQVTHTTLACGGVVLGIWMSRAVADAQSFFHFVAHFAHECSKKLGLESVDLASPAAASDFAPINQRQLMVVEKEEDEKKDPDNPNPPMRKEFAPSAYKLLDGKEADSDFLSAGSSSNERTVNRLLTFANDEIESISNSSAVSGVYSHATGAGSTTHFDTLTTHLFKFISKSRGLESKPSRPLKLVVDVNVRNRLLQRIPANFFGNASLLSVSLYSSHSLIKQNIAASTRLVHQAVHTGMQAGNNHLVLQWALNNASNTFSRVRPNFSTTNGDLLVFAWNKFPVYHVDFGFGRPVRAVPAALAQNEEGVLVYLPSPLENGDVEILVSLKESEMKTLLADDDFRQYQ